jgi:hypothetical protein
MDIIQEVPARRETILGLSYQTLIRVCKLGSIHKSHEWDNNNIQLAPVAL